MCRRQGPPTSGPLSPGYGPRARISDGHRCSIRRGPWRTARLVSRPSHPQSASRPPCYEQEDRVGRLPLGADATLRSAPSESKRALTPPPRRQGGKHPTPRLSDGPHLTGRHGQPSLPGGRRALPLGLPTTPGVTRQPPRLESGRGDPATYGRVPRAVLQPRPGGPSRVPSSTPWRIPHIRASNSVGMHTLTPPYRSAHGRDRLAALPRSP